MGEIDYDALAREIGKSKDQFVIVTVIINVNIGMTVKSAVDNRLRTRNLRLENN